MMFKIIKLRDSIVGLKSANNDINVKMILYNILSHFTGELICKQCNVTFEFKSGLKRHLLVHER